MRRFPSQSRSIQSRGDQGFILLIVLVFVGLAAATALYLTVTLRGSAIDLETESKRQRLHSAAISALRSLRAGIEQKDKAFLDADGRPVPKKRIVWDGIPVDLKVESENGKLDVNLADLDLITTLLHNAIKDERLASTLEERLKQARTGHIAIANVEDLLPVEWRFSSEAVAVRSILTIGRDRPTVDFNEAPRDVIAAVPGLTPNDRDELLRRFDDHNFDLTIFSRIPLHDTSGARFLRLSAQIEFEGYFSWRETRVWVSPYDQRLYVLSERDIPKPWTEGVASRSMIH